MRFAVLSSTGSTWREPRPALTAVFVAHGLLYASWTAHIPDLRARLGLSYADLWIALLGAPAGSVCAMIASARLIERLGSRTIARTALIGYCTAGAWSGSVRTCPQ